MTELRNVNFNDALSSHVTFCQISRLPYFSRMNLSNNPRPVKRGPPGEIGIK
jgi:hypothetical protein